MNGLATSVLGIVGCISGVLLGHLLTKDLQEGLLKKTVLLSVAEKTVDARVSLIKDVTSLFAEGQRLSYLFRSRPEADRVEFSRIISCISRESRAAEFCQTSDKAVADQLSGEVAQLYARFEAFKVMANYYYCSGTRDVISTLPAGAFWWNADASVQTQLLSSMRAELSCELDRMKSIFE
jgi:hypothetical protein